MLSGQGTVVLLPYECATVIEKNEIKPWLKTRWCMLMTEIISCIDEVDA
jgi:hypothetical protein